MNEEELTEISRSVTGCNRFNTCSWFVFCNGVEQGFQKGKLEAFSEVRKIMGEEVREYDENMEAYSFRVLKKIKQLQKEIGGEK